MGGDSSFPLTHIRNIIKLLIFLFLFWVRGDGIISYKNVPHFPKYYILLKTVNGKEKEKVNILSKKDIQQVESIIQELYLEDSIPWICGYSGGKDSTAIVQLVWNALKGIPKDKLKKKVHVINTDTLVESPVVSSWAKNSLQKMEELSLKYLDGVIVPHQLKPAITDTFWVNLIGKGYAYPRQKFRWCTERMKIAPSNKFIQEILNSESEAILVLGTRKAESASRRITMEKYERKRYRKYLSPNGSLSNSYVFTPIENWTNDNVWQYLMQYENPWGQSNKDLLAMYSGASADGECPLVLDTNTPSCGNSRFGCWVCTMVSEDKSMAAMIQNDEEKSWMLPLLDFRNYIAGYGSWETDRERRDFRRKNGNLMLFHDMLVHGPYKKEVREDFLRKLLEVENLIHEIGPEEFRNIPLIQAEELAMIRKIWLDEYHEFDDSLPRIYEEVKGIPYEDEIISGNKYFGKTEFDIIKQVCSEKFSEEQLLPELVMSLIDIEAKSETISNRYNILNNMEKQIKKCSYQNEKEAEKIAKERKQKQEDKQVL